MICTGLDTFYCPVHGDCTCSRTPAGRCCFDSDSCPLHELGSEHVETPELAEMRAKTSRFAEEEGVVLTAHDHEQVSRFAQLLADRSRNGPPLSEEAKRLRKAIL